MSANLTGLIMENNNKIISINRLLELVEKDAKLAATLDGFGKELTRLEKCNDGFETEVKKINLEMVALQEWKKGFGRKTKLSSGAIATAVAGLIAILSHVIPLLIK